MTHAYSASCIVAANRDGQELLEALRTLLEAAGFRVSVPPATQANMLQACLNDDLVIFDGSREPGHVYAAATGQPMTLDHVLVVSRTYLPINFHGVRRGGAPMYPRSFDNREILDWVRRQLPDLSLPRQNKGMMHSVRAMRSSLDAASMRGNAVGQVFLSFRAGCDDRTRSARQVMLAELARRIEKGDFHDGTGGRTAFFYNPGEVAFEDELLSEARHWQLASIIDRQLADADELWIVDTPDYLGSWWTQAELATVAYRRANRSSAPQVRRYDPRNGRLHPEPPQLLPTLTRDQSKRMARWYANCDPDTMGPESVVALRALASLPVIGKLPYLADPVWGADFWNQGLLRCPTVTAAGSETISNIGMNQFLWLGRQPGVAYIKLDSLDPDVAEECVKCPLCSGRVRLRPGPPRAVWMPIRLGRPTGPEGATLVSNPVWRATHLLP